MNRCGVSLRDLLENPDLLEAPILNSRDKLKLLDDDDDYIDSTLAFLGPNLWVNGFEGMLDNNSILSDYDFLTNNCLNGLQDANIDDIYSQHDGADETELVEKEILKVGKPLEKVNESPILKELIDHNIPLKCIIGEIEFNPAEKRFKKEELVVAPILPKSQKIFVPSEKKDEVYWKRREKNNSAAKRSRETRRIMNNKIAMRTAYLEDENEELRNQLATVKAENVELINKLAFYEPH